MSINYVRVLDSPGSSVNTINLLKYIKLEALITSYKNNGGWTQLRELRGMRKRSYFEYVITWSTFRKVMYCIVVLNSRKSKYYDRH